MEIVYSDTKKIDEDSVIELFNAFNWSTEELSGFLAPALEGSGCVFSAWYEGKLVGLINALDDGVMTVYIHYFIVDPAHQGIGIGRGLIDRIKNHYMSYKTLHLVSPAKYAGFYGNVGFEEDHGEVPMFIRREEDGWLS